ncbi:recombinase family protein [Patescibacteria group bacterium]|nr:recombinase family protein [Patescibacteria group bacterium]
MDGMLSSFAEFDNSMRAEGTKMGMHKRFKEGIWVWAAALGYYRPTKGKGANIFPHPKTATLVLRAFEEWATGTHTYKSLATYTTSIGLLSKTGKPLTPQFIEKMLRNPIYCGRMEAFGEVVYGTFSTIVSEDLFRRCQKKKKGANVPDLRAYDNDNFPLRRRVVCSECEQELTGSFSTGKKGMKYPYYHHGSRKCRAARSIPKEAFEQQFVELLDRITPNPQHEELFKAIVLDRWAEKQSAADHENKRIQNEVERLQEERQQVFVYHRTGIYSDEDFAQQKRAMDTLIEQKRTLLVDQWTREFQMNAALGYCFDYVRNTSKEWLESRLPRKNRLMGLVFKKPVPYDGENFGTPSLSLVYQLNQDFQNSKAPSGDDASNLVAPGGIEPPFTP